MGNFRYLKGESYYNDLYDFFTIEECLWWEKSWMGKKLSEFEGKKLTQKQQNSLKGRFAEFPLYFIKGGLNL